MSSQAPATLVDIGTRITQHLDLLLEREQQRWAGFDELLVEPFGEVRALVASGGKRLRPAFCHWGYVALGGDRASAVDGNGDVIAAQIALELLHASALLHDDIIDGAVLRRGEPTTYRRFLKDHELSGWRGESRRFGEGVGILAGDVAAVLADRSIVLRNDAVREVWCELRLEMNVGQLLDVIGSAHGDQSVERADRICRLKSGKYSIERPLHLGAALSEADDLDEVMRRLSAYGLPLGDAFQMRDDVIGVFGDESASGKPVGGDLREGKPTPLVARAIRSASGAQRRVLDLIGDPHLTDEQVRRIQEVIIATGALDELEREIAAKSREAVSAIQRSGFEDDAVTELVALASYITDRDR